MFIYAFAVVTAAISGIFIGFMITATTYLKKETDLLRHIAKQESSYEYLNEEYNELVDKYNKLVYKYNSLSKSKPNYKKEVIEAIKFAMIQSHPDKGICKDNELFIKFRKMYEDLR